MITWIVAAFIAFFVKGLCGFANTLVFTSILAFGTSNINISPVDLLLGYPANIIMAVHERKSIKWRVCLPLVILVLLGSLPGIWLLKNTNAKYIKIICGIIIILVGLEMLIREHGKNNEQSNKGVMILIGILSGILCGLYGIGALLGAYLGRITENTEEFKANICIVFFSENTFRIILYILTGIITFTSVKIAIVLVPVMLAGMYAGMFAGRYINEKGMKKVVLAALIFSGTALIINTLLG